MKYIEETELKTSKGYILDYFNRDDLKAQPNPNDTNLLLRVFETEPVIFAAINTIVNKAFESGYTIKNKSESIKKKILKRLKDLEYDLILPNIIRNVIIYGDAFLELVWEKGFVVELHVLETREMEIQQNEHGDVLGYVQRHGGKDPVEFDLDEVIHFTNTIVGSKVWGFTPINTLITTIATKKFAETHNRTKFQNNAPRIVWIAKDASEDQIKQLISYLKLAKENPHKDIVVEGDIDFKDLKIGDSDNNIPLLEYERTQILMAMQVPPIMIGLPDNSNRSNSEVQLRAFEDAVKALQRPIEFKNNNQFFPLLGYNNSEFQFKPIDKRSETEDMNIAKGLKDLGVKSENIIEFLRDAGLQLPDTIEIEEPKPMPLFGGGVEKDNKPFLGKKTGREAETRPEQLVGKTTNFGEYPYVIN